MISVDRLDHLVFGLGAGVLPWAGRRRVALEINQDPECMRLMKEFIEIPPVLWNQAGVEARG